MDRVITLERLFKESRELGLAEKADQTIVNLVALESQIGDGVPLEYLQKVFPGRYPSDRDLRGQQSRGRPLWQAAYACDDGEALVVMHYLREKGWISTPYVFETYTLVYITPEGYIAASRLRTGSHSQILSGFVICRFNVEDVEKTFNDVYSTISLEGRSIRLERIKDKQFIDRIDDRILLEIKKADFLLVDLTEDNFNVGFEAGYGLALGKPIVWTMRQPVGRKRKGFPFDIQSQNILLYSMLKLDQFRVDLEARIRSAIDQAIREQR